MKVDWDHLRFFLVLARAKTLTNAARLMEVEHSTVARRIQALENTLGTQLFKREAKGYELTAEGLALVPRVEQMEQSFIQIDKRHDFTGPGTLVRRKVSGRRFWPGCWRSFHSIIPR